MKRRYIVEIGIGLDLHGGDVTKASKKAVKDAISHSCLCGLAEILEVADMNNDLDVEVNIACPRPEKVRPEEVAAVIPFGNVRINEIVKGGLETRGLHVESLGEGDQIIVAIASVTVYVNC